MQIEIIWKNPDVDTDSKKRVRDLFESRNLYLKKHADRELIDETPGEDNFTNMWYCLVLLMQCNWFRDEVKSCVWTDDDEREDIIVTGNKLIKQGRMIPHD